MAREYPLSSAFLFGSSLTLALLSGAFVTRHVFVVRPWRAEMVRSVKMLEKRVARAERVKTLEDRVTEWQLAGSGPGMEGATLRREAIGDTVRKQRGSEVIVPSSPAPTIHIASSPNSTNTPAPAPPFPPTSPSSPKATPYPSTKSELERSKPLIRTQTPLSYTEAYQTHKSTRPSILAFHDLRAGLGKMGPMPVVDTRNPNTITFAETEISTSISEKEEKEKPKKRVPYSYGL